MVLQNRRSRCRKLKSKRNIRPRLVLAIALLVVSIAAGQRKEIIGYYPSWKWKAGSSAMIPAKIPFQKLTIINYAFFYPLSDGTLVGRDTVGDEMILQGGLAAGGSRIKSGVGLVGLAHQHSVKVLLSIGGWEDSDNFPGVAANGKSRTQFAHSCLDQIRKYDFDGIDIDWEYPCFADHRGKPGDRENCTLLVRVTRDSLDAYSLRTGKKLLLTAALPAGATHAGGFDLENLADVLDMFNVMTYDFSGTWDQVSGHNAPLYAPGENDTLRNVDAAFKLYGETYKIPVSKINLGIPFYGHTFANCTSLYGPYASPDTTHFSSQGCFYNDIHPLMGKFTRYWDDKAKVPYLVNLSWKTLVSYDDEESVGYKASYVLRQGAGGVIIWEITGDYLPDGKTPLLDVIWSKFNDAKSSMDGRGK